MNRKAQIFLPALAVTTLALFTFMAFMIAENNQDRENKFVEAIGYAPLSLIKIYDEGEKASTYLYRSAQHASSRAESSLKFNGGYANNHDCRVTQDNFVIWSSCSSFDPEGDFKKQFEEDFNTYLPRYTSTYPLFEESKALSNLRRDLTLLPQDVGEPLREKYTDLVRNAKIKSIEKRESFFDVTFEDIVFPVEYAPKDSKYTLSERRYSFTQPAFSVYDQLYLALDSCIKEEPDAEECSSFLSNRFPGVITRTQGTLVFISYENIRFAMDISQPLPPRDVFKPVA